MTGYRVDSRGAIPSRSKIILFCTVFRLGLGPIQTPVQWILGEIAQRGRVAKWARTGIVKRYLHSRI
jgi:hypothetical protein